MILTLLIFLLILSVLVLIHEAGHFFVAKKLGIKVEEFGFGLPPRAFGKKIGETIYSINWLPIGGFVKLYGEDDAGSGRVSAKHTEYTNVPDIKRAFFARPVSQRAAVVVAGVVMNAFLAALIFYIFLGVSGFKTEIPLIGDHRFFAVTQQNVTQVIISKVAPKSPAAQIGLKPMVAVLAINGEKITSADSFYTTVNKQKGKKITITWKDVQTGEVFTASVVPRVSPPPNEGALGVGFFTSAVAQLSYTSGMQKALSGIVHPVNLLLYNFDVMGRLLGISIKEKTAAPLKDTVSGPVGIYSIVGTLVQIPDLKEKVLSILNLAGILSISLAFFNILPIPALDGGRLFFILIEGISGRKVPAKYEAYAHGIGMAVLLTLLLFITFHDLSRIFGGFFSSRYGP